MVKIRGFEEVSTQHRKTKGKIKLPRRGTMRSSGYDFYLTEDVIIKPNERVLIWSDIKAYMQHDEELLMFPRSSLGVKGLVISNLVGKIDSDYYSNPSNDGNIGLTLWNSSTDKIFELKKGDRICQGTFYKYLVADDDTPLEEERNGGFGHTGLK